MDMLLLYIRASKVSFQYAILGMKLEKYNLYWASYVWCNIHQTHIYHSTWTCCY